MVVLYVESLYTQRRSSTAIPPDTEATLEVPEIQSRHAGSLSAFLALEGSGRQVPASLPKCCMYLPYRACIAFAA